MVCDQQSTWWRSKSNFSKLNEEGQVERELEAVSFSGSALKAVKWVITPGTPYSELQVLCQMGSPCPPRAAVMILSHDLTQRLYWVLNQLFYCYWNQGTEDLFSFILYIE